MRTFAKFIIRLFIFAIPLLLAVGALELALWQVGELTPLTTVVQRQQASSNVLFDRAIVENSYGLYKQLSLESRGKIDVLVVGSSRVLEFRDVMCHPLESEFYNAGMAINGVDDLERFVDRIVKRDRPRVLIVGIDPWWFKLDSEGVARQSGTTDPVYRPQSHLHAQRQLLFNGQMRDEVLFSSATNSTEYEPIGLYAYRGNGFRRDGSYFYGESIAQSRVDPQFRGREKPPIIERVRNQSHQFEPTAGLDEMKLRRLIAILLSVRQQGIEIIVVMPPVTNEVDAAILASPEISRWWANYWTQVPAALVENDIPVVACRTPEKYGLAASYMLDGFHPGEVLATYLIEDICVLGEEDSPLAEVDLSSLRRLRERTEVIPLSLELEP